MPALPIHTMQEARLAAALCGEEQYQTCITNPPIVSQRLFEVYQSYRNQLAHGFPLEYITGKSEFCGTPLFVYEGVLLPRPETEQWVSAVETRMKKQQDRYAHTVILDIGCGSGCIGLHLSPYVKHACLLDIFPTPLKLADRNRNERILNERDLSWNRVSVMYSDLAIICFESMMYDYMYQRMGFVDTSHACMHAAYHNITQKQHNHADNFFIDDNMPDVYIHTTTQEVRTIHHAGFDFLLSHKDYTKYKIPSFNTIIHSMNQRLNCRFEQGNTLSYKEIYTIIHDAFIRHNVLVVANLPYVPYDDMPYMRENNIEFEPQEAIFSDDFGLSHTYCLLAQLAVLPSCMEIHIELDERHFTYFS